MGILALSADEGVRDMHVSEDTLTVDFLLGYLDDSENQEIESGKSYLLLHPDRVILQDVPGWTAMLHFMQTERQKVAAPTAFLCL
jgi:aconitate hydratase